MALRRLAPLTLAGLASVVAADKPPCSVENMGYIDPNIDTVNGGLLITDSQTCQNTCAADVACYVFTYKPSDGECWLQGDGLEAQEMAGAISGPKVCRDADGSTLMPIVSPPKDLPKANTSLPPVNLTVPSAPPAVVGDLTPGSQTAAAAAKKTCGGEGCAAPPASGKAFLWVGLSLIALSLVGIVAYCIVPAQKAPKKPKRAKRGVELTTEASVEEGKPLMSAGDASTAMPPQMMPQYGWGVPQYVFQAPSLMAPQSYQYAYLDPQAQQYQYADPQVLQPMQFVQQPMQYATYA